MLLGIKYLEPAVDRGDGAAIPGRLRGERSQQLPIAVPSALAHQALRPATMLPAPRQRQGRWTEVYRIAFSQNAQQSPGSLNHPTQRPHSCLDLGLRGLRLSDDGVGRAPGARHDLERIAATFDQERLTVTGGPGPGSTAIGHSAITDLLCVVLGFRDGGSASFGREVRQFGDVCPHLAEIPPAVGHGVLSLAHYRLSCPHGSPHWSSGALLNPVCRVHGIGRPIQRVYPSLRSAVKRQ